MAGHTHLPRVPLPQAGDLVNILLGPCTHPVSSVGVWCQLDPPSPCPQEDFSLNLCTLRLITCKVGSPTSPCVSVVSVSVSLLPIEGRTSCSGAEHTQAATCAGRVIPLCPCKKTCSTPTSPEESSSYFGENSGRPCRPRGLSQPGARLQRVLCHPNLTRTTPPPL